MGERAETTNATVGAYSGIDFFEASLTHYSLFKN